MLLELMLVLQPCGFKHGLTDLVKSVDHIYEQA